ncbi:ATP-dependent helicase [Nakamurella alba]|nr:ATP-dependent DNA helicase [Nakamurella alba]
MSTTEVVAGGRPGGVPSGVPGSATQAVTVLTGPAPTRPLQLSADQSAVVGNTARRLRVLAGPGTGKTATLVETVAQRVLSGACRPDEILVLTFSRRAAAELSRRISARLGLTTRDPMVRTLHSYAYSLVRARAVRSGEPAPRMLGAGESDRMVRDLLAGHDEDGGGPWPAELRAALHSSSFADELRDLLLRSAERGLRPARIASLGRRNDRPGWVAAAAFATEYQQVSDLRQGSTGLGAALDQAELTAAALAVLADDELLSAEQRRIRRVFVDEYQDVDPAQARLIDLLATGADELVVVGDPDQSIYGFRGAAPSALQDIEVDATAVLDRSRRMSAGLVTATRRVAELLPGEGAHRQLVTGDAPTAAGRPQTEGPDLATDAVEIAVLPTAAQEASFVADQLRRAHLLEGVPWGSMAVLVRSPAAALPALHRAFAVAGVPVVIGGTDEPAAADPVVAALLLLLRCGLDPELLTGEAALELLGSPVAGLDPLAVRRLRRAVRAARPGEGSSADLVAGLLAGAPMPEDLAADLRPPVIRLRELLTTAREGAGTPTAEQLLWDLWQGSGVEASLLADVDRGGRAGQRADRTLDAVLAVFDMAADLADRLPLAGVRAFVDLVQGQQIPGDADRAGARSTDAVAVLSAHSAKGLEWDVVAIAGVQEATWPDLRPRGSLLHVEELIALAEQRPARTAGHLVLAEERRLFYVAATRARRRLICTAVSDETVSPSRFLYELSGQDELEVRRGTAGPDGRHRRLHLVDLLADLRRAVADPTDPATAQVAAAHLARLAAAGVRGAHPRDWYGLAGASTAADPVAPGATVRLSPSTVEQLGTCPLRAVLERRGARSAPGPQQVEGIAVHALAHGVALGMPEPELHAEIDRFLDTQEQLPPWQRERSRVVLTKMLRAAVEWAAGQKIDRTLLGTETALDVTLPPDPEDPAGRPVRIVGRLDWVSRDADGAVVVSDFKTAVSKPSKADVQANAQLGTYQIAVERGGLTDVATGGSPAGGAELVFLRSGSPVVLPQDPPTESTRTTWIGAIRSAADQLASAEVEARVNSRCARCPVRSSCPAHDNGRQVTR